MINRIRANLKLKSSLFIVFILHLALYITFFLDISIAIQVVGFLYLTFAPGIILLEVLKLDRLNMTEKVLFSAGLSIAFLMVIGMLMNALLPIIGVSRPLSEVPLIIVLSSVTLSLCLLKISLQEKVKSPIGEKSRLSLPLATPLFISLPILSVVGAIFVNASQGNAILLIMTLMISALVVLATFSKKSVIPRLYPIALVTIAVAMLFHTSLISSSIQGQADLHYEYYLAELTKNSSHWNPAVPWQILATTFGIEYSKFNGMSSITILPSIYSAVLKMNITWIFKIVYPLIFSLVPLALYQLFKIKVGEKAAFLATFFFIAQITFYTEMLGLARQMIAELFFVLLFIALYNEKINSVSRVACFIIFGFALIVSHYAISFIFMFLIFFTWLFSYLTKTRNKRITAGLVALFLVISFSWYIYVSESGPYRGILGWARSVYYGFGDIFNIEKREVDVKRGLGVEIAPSAWHEVGSVIAYATEFFVVLGFITLMLAYLRQRSVRTRDWEYYVLLSLNMALLAMSILLPGFGEAFRMARLYHVLLFFLAPLCVIGAEMFLKLILRVRSESHILSSVLILAVIIPYFLFQTGFVYEVTGDSLPHSIPLSGYRMGPDLYFSMHFIAEQDVFSAEWLSNYVDKENTRIYADQFSRSSVLSSYGMVGYWKTERLTNTTSVLGQGLVYLSWSNNFYGVYGVRFGFVVSLWNTTELSPIYNNMSKVYTNGGSEIYKNPNPSEHSG